jgi:hypothetical protein
LWLSYVWVKEIENIFRKKELNEVFGRINIWDLIVQRLEVLASLEMASLGSFPLLNHASRDFNE